MVIILQVHLYQVYQSQIFYPLYPDLTSLCQQYLTSSFSIPRLEDKDYFSAKHYFCLQNIDNIYSRLSAAFLNIDMKR